jgi:hypothetical protein
MTDSRLYRVTFFHHDGRTYPRIIVSATSEDDAIVQACQIELAPRRSVLSVEEYSGL